MYRTIVVGLFAFCLAVVSPAFGEVISSFSAPAEPDFVFDNGDEIKTFRRIGNPLLAGSMYQIGQPGQGVVFHIFADLIPGLDFVGAWAAESDSNPNIYSLNRDTVLSVEVDGEISSPHNTVSVTMGMILFHGGTYEVPADKRWQLPSSPTILSFEVGDLVDTNGNHPPDVDGIIAGTPFVGFYRVGPTVGTPIEKFVSVDANFNNFIGITTPEPTSFLLLTPLFVSLFKRRI